MRHTSCFASTVQAKPILSHPTFSLVVLPTTVCSPFSQSLLLLPLSLSCFRCSSSVNESSQTRAVKRHSLPPLSPHPPHCPTSSLVSGAASQWSIGTGATQSWADERGRQLHLQLTSAADSKPQLMQQTCPQVQLQLRLMLPELILERTRDRFAAAPADDISQGLKVNLSAWKKEKL